MLASLLGAIVVVLAAAPSAGADPVAAMNRCTQGQIPNHDSPHVTVRGNGGGSDPAGPGPANVLEPGDAFIIVPDLATKVSVDHWGTSFGPDGNGVAASTSFPYPGLFAYSPVLRFNNNPGGWVGAPVQATAFNRCTTFQGNAPARLLFGVNDNNLGDNGGAWSFHVMIYKASAPDTSALNRCGRGLSPDPGSQQVTVLGSGGGSVPGGPNPGNILSRGDVVRIVPDYTSWATVDYWGAWYGPEGTGTTAGAGYPFPDLFAYSPVLRFNNNPGGWVGSPGQATAFGGCLLWTGAPVRLLFGVNDPNTTDNSRGWTFNVMIYKA
jgi:hypothetical protein